MTLPKAASKVASTGTYVFFLAILFVTELALMEVGANLFVRLGPLRSALADAGILVAVFSLPLILYCQRLKAIEAGRSQEVLWLFLRILITIFLIEFVVMLLLSSLLPVGNIHLRGGGDAVLTLLLSAPPLWWMFRRLERRYRPVPLSDYLNSPAMLYILLLFMVFFTDLQKELILPFFLSEADHLFHKALSSSLTTVCIAPILWLLVIRPLQRSVLTEQARTQAVYDQVIDAVITFDFRGAIACFNPGAERLLGYSAEEMLEQPVTRVFTDGEKTLGRLVNSASAKGGSSGLFSSEMLVRRSDGTLLAMDVSISKLILRGKLEYLLIMRDISERRKAAEALQASESRFRQIFEQTDDAIAFLDPNSHLIMDVNGTMVRMFGHPRDALVGRGLEQVCTDESLEKILERISRIKQGETSQIDKLSGRQQDGSEIILATRLKVTVLGDMELVYCTFRDITDRVRMEAQAKEIQAKLIQTSRMSALGLMVSGVAHEINNPNNYILSNAQLLERSWFDACKVLREYAREHGEFLIAGIPFSQLDQDSPQLFSGIVDGSRRINSIVGNLKGFARQESVALDSQVDLNQVAREAISIIQNEIGQMTDDFKFESADNLPLVRGNRQQLGQVVVNLVMNACQALVDKSARVELKTGHDPETGEVFLTVRDEGCGMTAEASKMVMEPFFTTKLDSGGTGLGLSISRTIIKDHRGRLEFNSERGAGTTFSIRIPALEAEIKGNSL